jgi:hypothetical protein
MVQRLPRHLPMRLVPIGKPHVHHERISVVGAFNPIGARLWFQSHRDKSHFPNCPMVAKNLRLEGTSALRSGRRRRIAPGTQSKHSGFVPRGTNPCHLPALRIRFPPWPVSGSLPSQNAPASFLQSRRGIVPVGLAASNDSESRRTIKARSYMIGLPLKWSKLKAKGK